MNHAAQAEREAIEQELDRLVDDIARKSEGDNIREVQETWRVFAEAEATRRADVVAGGSMYPQLYHTAFKNLAADRLHQLKTWLEEEFFE
jgi:hypothetical protein